MRKHRLAECLLVDVIKLPLALVHQEACRWEHVISEEVEVRIYEMLNHPELSPFGNPIPGLADLLNRNIGEKFRNSAEDAISNLATIFATKVLITRLGESIQSEVDIFNELLAARIIPGAIIDLQKTTEGILIKADSEVGLTNEEASHIFGSPLS
jgi:DtxR family Mn-dependent transcriptional regulator